MDVEQNESVTNSLTLRQPPVTLPFRSLRSMTLRKRPMAHKSARILVVDHNLGGLRARRSYLQEAGHTVETATTFPNALERLVTGSFDVIVTDYHVGDMKGLELLDNARRVEPALRTILLSSLVDTLGLTETATGADAVVRKDADEVAHVLRAVARLMERPARKPAASSTPTPQARAKSA